MLPLALLLLLFQVKSLFASAPGIHCVLPADYPTPSPGDPDQPCLTLDQYTELNNFSSGTTLEFMPGNHSLELTLHLTEISNITLTRRDSNSTVNIICTNVGTIQCKNVTGLKIKGLRFILPINTYYEITSAVTFINCIDILVANTMFEGSEEYQFRRDTGRALSLQSTQATIWKCNFKGSRVSGEGGAIFLTDSTNLTIHGSSFIGNHAEGYYRGGGAVYGSASTLLLYNNHFTNNYASAGGGAIRTLACTVQMRGYNMFKKNYCDIKAHCRGGALVSYTGFIFSLGEVNFSANKAYRGGAIYMIKTNATFNGNSTLSGNNASGTLISTSEGGAMYITDDSEVTFTGNVTIHNNTAGVYGGGICAEYSLVVFQGNCIFSNNRAFAGGGGLFTFYGTVSVQGPTLFLHNKATRLGGALVSDHSTVEVKDRLNFTLNSAIDGSGGAMCFVDGGSLNLSAQDCMISSSFNSARDRGGFIYKEDIATSKQCDYKQGSISRNFQMLPECFLQITRNSSSYNTSRSLINSYNDSAGIEGSVLYGGLLDRCRNRQDNSSGLAYLESELIKFHPNGNTPVTSPSYELCVCGKEECAKSFNMEVYKGQTFRVPLLAKGQVNATSTIVIATIEGLDKLEPSHSQQLPNHCHSLPFAMYSSDSYGEIKLYPDGPCRRIGFSEVSIYVTFLPCPDGFTDSGEMCSCVENLRHYPGITCNIADTPYFTKTDNSKFWMDFSYVNTTYQGLILGSSCPAEYCKQGTVNVTIGNPDYQCDLNRARLLCGACAANHSLMLGGPQCQVCPNTYLALLLPFAAAGVALVVFLTSIRLTVATGTLQGIILYANIVQVNRNLFFPHNDKNILTVFIAWMNLDLGFQTCFYDRLDAYALTWLQFVFPLYVWFIIGVMIFISRYSITASKFLGSNPVAVLATLLLMSYTSIVKIIIGVYSFAKVDFPDKTVIVWLKDASVRYLGPKHLILAVDTSFILLLLFLPYTLLLLLGHKLYRFTDKTYLRWLNRVKPLLDSYYAPYKNHTRYWTGFLLLVRCALYIVFAFTDKDTNLLTIALTFTVIGLIVCYLRVYSSTPVNIIESCIYLNLIVLSVTALIGRNTAGLVYFLVALVFMIMILLCAHQFYLLYIAKTAPWQKLKNKWLEFRKNSNALISEDTLKPDSSLHEHKSVTETVIELREPLLDD